MKNNIGLYRYNVEARVGSDVGGLLIRSTRRCVGLSFSFYAKALPVGVGVHSRRRGIVAVVACFFFLINDYVSVLALRYCVAGRRDCIPHIRSACTRAVCCSTWAACCYCLGYWKVLRWGYKAAPPPNPECGFVVLFCSLPSLPGAETLLYSRVDAMYVLLVFCYFPSDDV